MKPVPNIRCTMPKPCGHCHYCKVHKDGPLYWLKVKPKGER
jgi:hypothetical protein